MSGGNRRRGRDDADERIDTVRAEALADRDGDVHGTPTESYTLTPPVSRRA